MHGRVNNGQQSRFYLATFSLNRRSKGAIGAGSLILYKDAVLPLKNKGFKEE
ncbi:hypothetical protein KIN20_014358 [Parelaphostrongylus tenuis]|uniref:Uncharacterized protein n=1 Tax=Parelaphostrongylus tenuis TaxID=148309 RepID=A0AAD5N362_PARTN|nr:hypothetical protein KIN20_014358 [Parelaphostrongylus tenuis]